MLLFEDLQRHCIKHDTVTYSALISACLKGRSLPTALQLCEDLPRQDIKPDTITYNALISACGKGTQPEQGFESVSQ